MLLFVTYFIYYSSLFTLICDCISESSCSPALLITPNSSPFFSHFLIYIPDSFISLSLLLWLYFCTIIHSLTPVLFTHFFNYISDSFITLSLFIASNSPYFSPWFYFSSTPAPLTTPNFLNKFLFHSLHSVTHCYFSFLFKFLVLISLYSRTINNFYHS